MPGLREQPRQQSKRPLSSPGSQLPAEQPSMKKTRTSQKKSYTAKDIKKEPQQNREKGQTHNAIRPHCLRWVSHKMETNLFAVSLTEARVLSPTPGPPAQESGTER